MSVNRRMLVAPHHDDPAFTGMKSSHGVIIEQLFPYMQHRPGNPPWPRCLFFGMPSRSRSLHHKIFDLGAFTLLPGNHRIAFSRHLHVNGRR